MFEKNQKIILALLAACAMAPAYGMNVLFRPYDTLLRPETYLESCNEFALWAETGVKPATGFNGDGDQVNVLRIWNPDQDALAMLNGFPANSPISQFLTALNAFDDGTRGHLLFDGTLRLNFGGVFGARWYFLPHAWITAFIPYYSTSLKNIGITDLTQSNTAADLRVRNALTGNLASVIDNFGNGLSLDGWKRTGPGDLNLLVEWMFNYPQARPLLKNVEIDARAGFTLPTGLKSDIDKIFAFPYGYNGAVGLLYGAGLIVTLGCQVKAGFDIQLLHLFGNTRERRIKTALNQTELLLLAKTDAYIDYGLTQRFNLFLQAYHFYDGVSFLAGYQFLKKGEDQLALNSCDFSTAIANTAPSLDEWIVHSIELNLHYDYTVRCPDAWGSPQFSLFARIPFNGKRAAAFTTIGFMAAVDF